MRNLNKGNADIETFDLKSFLEAVYKITKGTIIIFCAKEQFSFIFGWFAKKDGTVRELIWEKSNPAPLNGEYVYLSGVENAVWFKKRGGVFNARCKNTVFKYPIWGGKKRIHPTEKNHDMLAELIEDNSNEGDLVFDPCCGSASTCLVARNLGRKFVGIERDREFYERAVERLSDKE